MCVLLYFLLFRMMIRLRNEPGVGGGMDCPGCGTSPLSLFLGIMVATILGWSNGLESRSDAVELPSLHVR